MNGADLNLPGKPRVIKIDRTSIFNNDGMIDCLWLFRDKMCEVHLQKFT